MSVKSPCVGICTIDNDICIGCFRSIQEITEWIYSTEEHKQQIIENVTQRRALTDNEFSK